MSDLISRQAAIDALDVLCQEHRYKIPGKGETYSQYNEAWQDALGRAEGAIFNLPSAQPQTSMLTVECKLDDEELAKAIEEVKKANLELIAAEPHWIPCSEQLPPEENKTYWVCTDNGYQHECRWTNVNPIWTHLTTDWHWNIFDIPQYTKVVAWMELPKPYDVGEQDG